MNAETNYILGSAENDWSISLAVADAEQADITANSYSYRGRSFRTERLRIRQQWRSGPTWELSGPNIRINGSLGKLWMTAIVTKGEADAGYPETMKAARALLTEMCDEVRRQAEAAVRQLQEAAA